MTEAKHMVSSLEHGPFPGFSESMAPSGSHMGKSGNKESWVPPPCLPSPQFNHFDLFGIF